MLGFVVGLVVGTFAGFLLLGLLAGPHIAELESTIAGLWLVINDLTGRDEG